MWFNGTWLWLSIETLGHKAGLQFLWLVPFFKSQKIGCKMVKGMSCLSKLKLFVEWILNWKEAGFLLYIITGYGWFGVTVSQDLKLNYYIGYVEFPGSIRDIIRSLFQCYWDIKQRHEWKVRVQIWEPRRNIRISGALWFMVLLKLLITGSMVLFIESFNGGQVVWYFLGYSMKFIVLMIWISLTINMSSKEHP